MNFIRPSTSARRRPIFISATLALLFLVAILGFSVLFVSLQHDMFTLHRSKSSAEFSKIHKQIETVSIVRGQREKARLNYPVILILTFNRPSYLTRQLASLKNVAHIENFHVIISQDGENDEVKKVIEQNFNWTERIIHSRSHPALGHAQESTAWLAQHYKWALDFVFHQRNASHVVIVEDDLEFAPDFLRLFEQTGYLLDIDETLWCISSWNDLGFPEFTHDNRALRRTDFFPGLGWMLRRQLWLELGPIFPTNHWDHWMRLDTIAKGRSCVFPEISRNHNFGAAGSTVAFHFFRKFLQRNTLNVVDVEDFGQLDYLLQEQYDMNMNHLANHSVVIEKPHARDLLAILSTRLPHLTSNSSTSTSWLIPFELRQYKTLLANPLHLMSVPRSVYRGDIVLHLGSGGYLVLADRRESVIVPVRLRIERPKTIKLITGSESQSCDKACAANHSRCAEQHFQWINSCSVLQSFFPCENGCWGSVVGPDVPNYVSNRNNELMWGFCTTTEGFPTCSASHPSTSRICPCIHDDIHH